MQSLMQLVGNIWPRSMPTPVHQADPTRYDFINDDCPPEIQRLIFSFAKKNLQEIALVSRKWKEMAYDKELYRMIVPRFRFGEEEWKKYIGVPEKETLLPLCVFKDIERGDGYLTWVFAVLVARKSFGR